MSAYSITDSAERYERSGLGSIPGRHADSTGDKILQWVSCIFGFHLYVTKWAGNLRISYCPSCGKVHNIQTGVVIAKPKVYIA